MQKADVPPDWDEGTATDRKVLWHSLTDYLVKDAKTNSSAVVTKDRKGAKEARLSFWILSCREVQEQRMAEAAGVLGYVLAEIQLDTGRIIRSGCRWRMPDFRSLVIENIIRIGNCMQRRGRRRR